MIRLWVEGLMLERLMERALEQGAMFSRVRRDGPRAMVFETDERGERILRALCEKYSLRTRTLRTGGLPAFKRLLRRRWTLLPAALVCALLLLWYTQRIWRIDVSFEGERPAEVGAGEVLGMLAEMGVRPGMAAREVNTELLALELSARTQAFSFIGARVKGVQLLVELAPSLDAPDLYNLSYARDLVAACDGVIVSINAQSGVAAVKPGDTVRKGDVLIRGEERVSKEETRGVAALGEVVARVWVAAEAEADTHRIERTYTGRASAGSALTLLNWSIPLAEENELSPAETEVEYLPVGGMFLPLMIVRTTQREYVERAVPLDEAALRGELSEQAFWLAEAEIARIGLEDAQIVDKWIDYSMIEEGRLHARAVVELHRDIATTREALAREG